MNEVMVKQDGQRLELAPLRHCLWCLSTDHLLEQCAEKHDFFALTWSDEKFLHDCGVWYPRWVDNKFLIDPYYESEEIQ